ncbi:hypothetical protein EJB05_14264, partial [Eragrostis curvula]
MVLNASAHLGLAYNPTQVPSVLVGNDIYFTLTPCYRFLRYSLGVTGHSELHQDYQLCHYVDDRSYLLHYGRNTSVTTFLNPELIVMTVFSLLSWAGRTTSILRGRQSTSSSVHFVAAAAALDDKRKRGFLAPILGPNRYFWAGSN